MPRTQPQGGAEPMRALVYARYSTSLQSGASIDDQVRICRERAEREGWDVAGVFTDAAVSGSVRARPGLDQLLGKLAAGDVLLSESIDRISRNFGDVGFICDHVRFAGARIVTLSEGEIGTLHAGLKGTMAQLYREDLADKTRRGQTGRVLAGRCPGGLAYGYRRVARLDDRGEAEKGLREVDEEQAAVIRRIFAEFVDGRSPRAIARRLNAESIPGPSGGPWSAASINGDRVRKNGILQNELYRGVLVFNRTRRFQDPLTRKKRIRPTPIDSWTVRAAPELRIVSDDLWEAVSARRARFDGTRAEQQRRPKRLLSGLVRCGCCNGSYIVIGAEKWGCGNRRQRGSCSNGRTIQTHMLERRVLDCLTNDLLAPEAVRAVELEYHRAAHARAGEALREQRKAERRRDTARVRVDRLLRAVTDGGAEFVEIRDALARARAELETAEAATLEAGASSVIALHPGIADRYRREVADLRVLLSSDDDDQVHETRRLIRSLIDQIVVSPAANGPGTAITLEGRLTAILNLAGGGPVSEGRVCQRWCPGGDSHESILGLKRGRC